MTDIEQVSDWALTIAAEAAGSKLHHYERMADDNRLAQSIKAHARAIEQHEAFRQEVSDAVHKHWGYMPCEFDRFIVTKPDPLAECLLKLGFSEDDQEARHDAEWLVKTIEKRGGKIVWGEG